jgi:cyclopropane fatty-acyl-phospholipid synthase-like methyltransferase
MRQDAEKTYDLEAPEYAEKGGTYSNISQQEYIQKFLSRLAPNSRILDAACGAGRYMSFLLEKGHTVFGIDQSQGMLSRAQEFFPTVQTQKMGLQEMSFHDAFDGMICMDAMEHICPEDWLPILHNFHNALKPKGYLYFTVELAEAEDVEEAFKKAQQQGLPVVYGEWENSDVYHYYPSTDQVREWLQQAGFNVIEEGEGDGYHHFIVQKT